MLALRRKDSGFTLLELIIVVIVIGILASIALPRYLQVAEKGRISEAKSMLGALRSAQLRYAAQYSAFTTNYNNLDINSTASRYFVPSVTGVDATQSGANADTTVVAWATRTTLEAISGPAAGYNVTITQGGTLTSTDSYVSSRLM